MFRWRRRDQGFEWRQYVRTTILVRRERRRERLDEARQAAAVRLKQAGREGLEASASGAARAADWLRHGLRAAGEGIAVAATRAARLPAHLARAAGPRLAPALRFLARAGAASGGVIAAAMGALATALRHPGVALSLGVVAAACVLAALAHLIIAGFDSSAALPIAIAATATILLLLARPWSEEGNTRLLARLPSRWQTLPRSSRLVAAATAGVLLLAAGGGAWWLTGGTKAPGAAIPGARTATASSSGTVSGRAVARSGDTLVISGSAIRLNGIEAPLEDQTCARKSGGQRWKCGHAATQALAAMVRGKSVSCELTRRSADTGAVGACRVDGKDLAAELVRRGHVFAAEGLFATYASHEGEARGNGSGLWAGEAERPADFRAKRWEEAKRVAPDGCPIKARVTAQGRIYLLPWTKAYDSAKVRSSRGERWFCSEAEAKAAGWHPARRS
jgi:endonuclease YncB( thermonuclease family)